jgi:hypothetical protein
MSAKAFYEVLFNKGEWTSFGDDPFSTKTYPAIETGSKSKYEFFVINPLVKGSTRADSNVETYRNFLFEIDEYKVGDEWVPVPKKIQATIIHKCGLPYSTCVDTAGKSLHWIVSLEDSDFIKDKVEYTAMWKAVQSIINKTAEELGYPNIKIDNSTKNPSRFSRAAEAVRTYKIKTPAVQPLKKIKGRIHSDEIALWLESHGVDWVEFMPKPIELDPNATWNPSASDQEKIDYILKWKMKNEEEQYEKGNRHHYQVKLAGYLLRTGMSPESIDAYFIQEFGEVSSGIGSVSKLNFDVSNPIYVWSKEEKIEYAKQQRRLEEDEELEKFTNLLVDSGDGTINNGDVADLNIGGLHNYIRVGTKYYRADDFSIEVWDKQTIKDDFGPRALHDDDLRKYRGFINEPNYLERVEHITKVVAGVPQTFYNRFRFPDWKLAKGKFPTTMTLLKRVFVGESEDQLEIGLDWIQLMLTKPKQRTRSLILVGLTEVGKDTFMEWLISLVGANGILIGGEEIESPFNSSWAGKHLVCLNEVSYDMSDKKTKERIKNLLTGKMLTVEGKGDNRFQIENYTKVIMATNNAYDFMQISSTENRFWVREMVAFGKSDPDFVQKLESEMSAFLYWITKERQLFRTEKATRFWHSNEECQTEAGNKVVENTKTNMYDIIRNIFEDKFNEPKMLKEDVMYVRAKSLTAHMNRDIFNARDRYQEKAVRLCLLKEFGAKDQKTERRDAFNGFDSSNNSHFTITRQMIGLKSQLPASLEDMLSLD